MVRNHRQTPEDWSHPTNMWSTAPPIPNGAAVYKKNGKFYWSCGHCGKHGGPVASFTGVMGTLTKHGLRCLP